MTEPRPTYTTTAPADSPGPTPRLPRRAWNLARRMLDLEARHSGRGRFTLEVVMVDGQWFLSVSKPIQWEVLEE